MSEDYRFKWTEKTTTWKGVVNVLEYGDIPVVVETSDNYKFRYRCWWYGTYRLGKEPASSLDEAIAKVTEMVRARVNQTKSIQENQDE